jgi:hypothetical protein
MEVDRTLGRILHKVRRGIAQLNRHSIAPLIGL